TVTPRTTGCPSDCFRTSLSFSFNRPVNQLGFEQFLKVSKNPITQFVFVNGTSQFYMKRCNPFPTNAARYDIVKITQINICVECKTMHGHPSGSPNTHRTDFTSKRSPDIQPHSSFPLTSGSGQSIVGQSHDDRLLKQPEVFVNIGK